MHLRPRTTAALAAIMAFVFLIASGNAAFISPVTGLATGTDDATAPSISGVSVQTYQDGAQVQYTVDEEAYVIINYGPTTELGSVTTTLPLSMAGSIGIGSLKPYTTYYYSISATDKKGNRANTIVRSFTTGEQTCVPDGELDDVLYETLCCSGTAVKGSTLCANTNDWYNGWASCTQICGTTGVTAQACPHGPTGTDICPCPSGTTNNGRYGIGVCVEAPATCSDTDGGYNTATRGKLSYGSETLTDSCIDNSRLTEAYCERHTSAMTGKTTYVTSTTITCPNGCSEGACIETATCYDTDGGIVYGTRGSTTGWYDANNQRITLTDSCMDKPSSAGSNVLRGDYIAEVSCSGNVIVETFATCANGCVEGACVETTATCTDTDGGYNTATRGKLSYGSETLTDSCIDSNRLTEAYCERHTSAMTGKTTYVTSTTITCPDGCSEGACVAAPTSDAIIRIGSSSAPVTIIMYGGFQDSFSRRFMTQTFPSVFNNYITTGQVQMVFKQFPLPFHEYGQRSAEAVYCANELGAGTTFNTLLFSNEKFDLDSLRAYAAQSGLSSTTFGQCLDSGKHASTVQRDIDEGTALGVTGTPTFFINDEMIVGAQPYESFERAIEAALREDTAERSTPEDTDDDIVVYADTTIIEKAPKTNTGEKKDTEACSGCVIDGACKPVGSRFDDDGTGRYCAEPSVSAMQRTNGENCSREYECVTGTCTNGVCGGKIPERNQGLAQRVRAWLDRFFK